MDFRDERLISAPPQKVWEYLLDPEILKECVPGCENFTGNITDGFEAIIVQKIGPVKAKFKGLIFLSDLDAPNSVRISGNGDGGIAGFAKGGAHLGGPSRAICGISTAFKAHRGICHSRIIADCIGCSFCSFDDQYGARGVVFGSSAPGGWQRFDGN